MNKNVIFIGIAIGCLAFNAGCGNEQQKSADKLANSSIKVTKVETAQLEQQIFKKQIRIQGTIKPVNKAIIAARMGGIIDSLNVKEGDYVVKGDLLFQTDKANLENQVLSSKKLVETVTKVENYAKSDIPVAQANKEKVALDYKRDKELFKNEAISKSDLEKTEVNYKAAAADVEKAGALTSAVNTLAQQMTASLNIAEKSLADSKVYAPYDGYIVSKKMNAGEYAMPGMPVLEIENNNELEIVCRLSAVYYEQITDKSKLDISYAGKFISTVPVTYKAPKIDVNTRTFEIKAILPREEGIISGLLCDVSMIIESHDGMGILNTAIIPQKGRSVIFTEENGKAVEKTVTIGLTNGNKTELLACDELKNKKIIVTGNYYLNDGDPVVDKAGEQK